jgi:hypothetical protein
MRVVLYIIIGKTFLPNGDTSLYSFRFFNFFRSSSIHTHVLSIFSSFFIFGFFFPLLHNHFITEFFLKKKSGEANDEANFSFFILLHKRAKPALHPYLIPHSARVEPLAQ